MIYLLFLIGFFLFLAAYFFVRKNETAYVQNSGVTAAIFETKKRRRFRYLLKFPLLIIAAAFPIALLTFRSLSVGTDTPSYYQIYQYVFEYNISYKYFGIEYGSYLVMRLGYTLFGSFTGVLFLFACITVIPAMGGIIYFSKKIQWPLIAAAYIAIVYPSAFNEMRQLAAISLIFFAFKYIDNRNYFAYLAFVILATLLHTSAVIAVFVLLLRLISSRGRIVKAASIVVVLTFPLWCKYISDFVFSLELFEKYARVYKFDDASWSELIDAFANQLGIFYPAIIGMALLSYWLVKRDRFNFVLLCTAAFAFSANLLVAYNEWAYRLPYIFYPAILYSVAVLPEAFSKNLTVKTVISVAVVLYLAYYTYTIHYIYGGNEIFPYLFGFIT